MNIIDYGALDNKYTTWYNNICQQALLRSTTRKEAKLKLGYTEGHHIIPKCITPNKNIVYLTMREHFLVHWLLSKMFTGSIKYKLLYALNSMARGEHRKLTSRQLEICKRAKRTHCSAERAKSISDARKLTPKMQCEFCNKITCTSNYKGFHGANCKLNPNIDKNILLERSKQARANANTQLKNGNFNSVKSPTGTFQCPHCPKIGTNYGAMHQFHFNNCFNLTGIKHKRPPLAKCSCVKCHKVYDSANFSRHSC